MIRIPNSHSRSVTHRGGVVVGLAPVLLAMGHLLPHVRQYEQLVLEVLVEVPQLTEACLTKSSSINVRMATTNDSIIIMDLLLRMIHANTVPRRRIVAHQYDELLREPRA